MSGKLAAELKQNKPFRLLEEEALLNLVRTHEHVQQRQAEFFREFQITPTQYNVLRILRGAGADGHRCSEIGERMITRDPDITRLLDRMEAAGWVRRAVGREDRRTSVAHITARGLELLAQVDEPLNQVQRELLVGISAADRAELGRLLGKLLESAGRVQPRAAPPGTRKRPASRRSPGNS